MDRRIFDPAVLDEAFLLRHDVPGPRYTSYPPAPQFRSSFTTEQVADLWRRSNDVGDRCVSVYVHVPFCPKQCAFCGCTTEINRPAATVRDYFEALECELDRGLALLDPSRPLRQVHFGGGTPNAVPPFKLQKVLDRLRAHFPDHQDAEIALEADPNLLSRGRLSAYRNIGFNRISFGLQDFDREVLAAVDRSFSRIPPATLVSIARELGFRGINLDLITGLPRQTPESWERTLQQALDARPDRFATFTYAHVPWVRDHQKILENRQLPGPADRIRMAVLSLREFLAAGYVPIGMDHWALPGDDLAEAFLQGRLHRNFQGYCSRRTTGQVYGFGASAISQLHEAYLQNIHRSDSWACALKEGQTTVERGHRLTPLEHQLREVINRIMCTGGLDRAALGRDLNLDQTALHALLAQGEAALPGHREAGLVEGPDEAWRVTGPGWLAVRVVALSYDILHERTDSRYSRAV